MKSHQPLTEEGRKRKAEKCRLTKLGNKNPMWKGTVQLSREAIHSWVNNNIGIPKRCSVCGSDKNIDLANTTGRYERDFGNWKYLCRKHHMESDDRLKRFLEYAYNHSKRFPNK